MNTNLNKLIEKRTNVAKQIQELQKERKRLNNAIVQARYQEKKKKI